MENGMPKFELGQLVYCRKSDYAWAPILKGRIVAVITTKRAHQTDYFTYEIKVQVQQETPVDAWKKPDKYSARILFGDRYIFESYEEVIATWDKHANIQVQQMDINCAEEDARDLKRQLKENQQKLAKLQKGLKCKRQRLKKLEAFKCGESNNGRKAD